MNKLNHLIFTSFYIILWIGHIPHYLMDLPHAPIHFLTLLHIDVRPVIAICYLYVVYSTTRIFLCLVSRSYYIKQMPNNNKMALSQLPY